MMIETSAPPNLAGCETLMTSSSLMTCFSSGDNFLVNQDGLTKRASRLPLQDCVGSAGSVHSSQRPIAGWTLVRGMTPLFVIVKEMGVGRAGSI